MIYKLKSNITCTCIFVFYFFMFTSLFFVTKLGFTQNVKRIENKYLFGRYRLTEHMLNYWLLRTSKNYPMQVCVVLVIELLVVPSTHCYMSLLIREWQLVVKGMRKTKLTTASPYGGWAPGSLRRSTAPMGDNPHNPAMSPHTLPQHPSH